MHEQVKVSAREGEAEFRCPYCHDLLGEDEPGEARVDCEGCGTSHHLACLTELGRCTVLGCDRPIDAAVLEERPPATSRMQRLIRQRQRDRVRQFVRRNTQAAEGDLREARLAGREGGWGRQRAPSQPLWGDAFVLHVLIATGLLVGLAALISLVVALSN